MKRGSIPFTIQYIVILLCFCLIAATINITTATVESPSLNGSTVPKVQTNLNPGTVSSNENSVIQPGNRQTTGNPNPSSTTMDWIHYENGVNWGTLAYVPGGEIEWGIRLTPEEFQGYDKETITTIRFYHGWGAQEGEIRIYEGNTPSQPGNLITTQLISIGTDNWYDIILFDPVKIDASKDLWITIHTEVGEWGDPMGYGPGPLVSQKGGWINLDNGGWEELLEHGWTVNWNIWAGLGSSLQFLSITGNQGIEATITNAGDSDINDISWEMKISKTVLGLFPKKFDGTIPTIQPQIIYSIETGDLVGFGRLKGTIQATASNAASTQKSFSGFIFGKNVIIFQTEEEDPSANIPKVGLCLWDNGDTDGTSAYSNMDESYRGFSRSILDDFTVPENEIWRVTGLESLHVWVNNLPAGSAIDFDLKIRTDVEGTPGEIIAIAENRSNSEDSTGRGWSIGGGYWFEVKSIVNCAPIDLPPGNYWIEGNVVSSANNFWLIHTNYQGSECWVNYTADYRPLKPASHIFGDPAGIAFKLLGYNVKGMDLSIGSVAGGRGIKAAIENPGTALTTYILWRVTIDRGIILGKSSAAGVIEYIVSGDTQIISTDPFFGFGPITITITAESVEGIKAEPIIKTGKIRFFRITLDD